MQASMGIYYCTSFRQKKYQQIPDSLSPSSACFSNLTGFREHMMAAKAVNVLQKVPLRKTDPGLPTTMKLLRTIPRVRAVTKVPVPDSKNEIRLLVKLAFDKTDGYQYRFLMLQHTRELLYSYYEAGSPHSVRSAWTAYKQLAPGHTPKTAVGFSIGSHLYTRSMPADHPIYPLKSNHCKAVVHNIVHLMENPDYGSLFITLNGFLMEHVPNPLDGISVKNYLEARSL